MSFIGSNTGGFGQSSGANLGRGDKLRQVPNFTPDQMNLFKSLFSNVGPESFTGRLAQGDEGTFNQIEKPALEQFSGILGNTASRFSGMGSGARKSSGFQNYVGSQSRSFADQLQSNRVDLQKNAIRDLMEMSGQLLHQKPFDSYVERKKPSFWERLLGGVGENVGSLPGMFARTFTGGF